MKVLHLPTSVGGMSWGLAQGERRLGLDSKVLVTTNNWLNYPCDFSLGWEKKGNIAKLLSAVQTMVEINGKYDVLHFNFGTTLIHAPSLHMYHWDLHYYGRDKKIVFTYNGCDARLKYESMKLYDITCCRESECYGGNCNSGKLDAQRKKSIAVASKYADHIFAVNPDLLNFLPREKTTFLPYAVASWYQMERCTSDYRDRRIRIAHSPTNRAVKGSGYILKALENLQTKYDIDLLLVEGVSNSEAIEMYRSADLVIDQVLAGWYGGFAVEVMKMGKPVAVYIREEDLKYIPEEMSRDLRDAVININPYNISEVLDTYLQNRDLLKQKSDAGYDYALKWHDPEYVASITRQVYEN